ncbi:hypothetical protein H0R94_02275 [Treponema socranskii]|uniref:hypothetical protein n=1 Tax=Treponema socranskii TaxID=53419 RepID=UPI003D8B3DEE
MSKKKLNDKNDIKKKIWNRFVPKVKEKDLSGNYKGQNKKGKTFLVGGSRQQRMPLNQENPKNGKKIMILKNKKR